MGIARNGGKECIIMTNPTDTETTFKVWTFIQEYDEDSDRYTEHDTTPLQDFGSIEAAQEYTSLLEQVNKDDISARILLKQTLHLLDNMTTTQYERGYDKRLRTRITLFLNDTEKEHEIEPVPLPLIPLPE